MRKIIAVIYVLGISSPAVFAQDNIPWEPPMQDVPERQGEADPFQQGLEGLMNDFMNDLAPELERFGENLSGRLDGLAPVLQDLAALGEDLKNYEAPERLENGDILIRRKADAPPPPTGDNLPDLSSPDNPFADKAPKDRIPDIVPRNPDLPEFEL